MNGNAYSYKKFDISYGCNWELIIPVGLVSYGHIATSSIE